MDRQLLTASQTVGPFFSIGLLYEDACRNVLVQPETNGERIRVEGRVIDGDGVPVPDALIEIWQANASGRYAHPADQGPAPLDPTFVGFGRTGTDVDGYYWFETIKPGAVPFNQDTLQAPHICVTIFARGLLNHMVTRLYFADELTNTTDPVLCCVPEERRPALLAQRAPAGSDSTTGPGATAVYNFDVIMQGEGETPFFNL
jgi:protocatechuate 3,4-dioxygenase alpha subunit